MAEDKIKEILGGNIEIPGIVDEKIQAAYDMLGRTRQSSRDISSIKYYFAGHRKFCAMAAVFCAVVITVAVNWNSVYTFAKNILVKQESYIGKDKLELPGMSYIKGRFPEDMENIEEGTYTNSKRYKSIMEAEKDFGITLLKNSMSDGMAHNAGGIITSFDKYDDELEYYNGRVDISVAPYIIKGLEPACNSDGTEEGYYKIKEKDYIMLHLDITCYIDSEKTRKGAAFEEEWEDVKPLGYYLDDTVGTVAIWETREGGDVHARFIYKDIQYELGGTATMEQLKEAVAAFYE